MEVAGLALSAVALATLFNTCVECFETFSQGRNLEKDLTYLLIRLDFEKTQLLLWGNSSGILKIEKEDRHARLADSTVSKLVKDALGAIQSLLSDASLLQQRYGVKSSTATLAKKQSISTNLLSPNSMNLFRTSWSRFCIRAAQALPDRSTLSTASKARWAVHDKSKFEELLDKLSNLVEKLHTLIPVPDSQHNDLENDLATIDISQLRLVEAALQSSSPRGRALSKAASVIISNSEIGTIDQRAVVEWLQDTQWSNQPNDTNTSSTSTQPGGRLGLKGKLDYLVVNTKKSVYFVNTPECRNIATSTPSPTIMSDRRLFTTFGDQFHSNSSESIRALFPNLAKCENFQPDSYAELFEGLQRSSHDVQAVAIRRINQMLPFGIIYIHTNPCQCAIQTALCIADALNDDYLKAVVRIDERISSSCFRSIADRIVVLQSMLAHLDTLEPFAGPSSKSLWRHMDRTWLDQRLYTLESDLTTEDSSAMSSATDIFSEENYPNHFAGLIIVGEVDFCTPLLQAEPFPWTQRFPRKCEVFEISHIASEYSRKYVGRFVARPPITDPDATLPQQQALKALHLETERAKSRLGTRSASLLKPGTGKRRAAPLVTYDRGGVASDSSSG